LVGFRELDRSWLLGSVRLEDVLFGRAIGEITECNTARYMLSRASSDFASSSATRFPAERGLTIVGLRSARLSSPKSEKESSVVVCSGKELSLAERGSTNVDLLSAKDDSLAERGSTLVLVSSGSNVGDASVLGSVRRGFVVVASGPVSDPLTRPSDFGELSRVGTLSPSGRGEFGLPFVRKFDGPVSCWAGGVLGSVRSSSCHSSPAPIVTSRCTKAVPASAASPMVAFRSARLSSRLD
jgi:hypothetical protein